MASRHGRTKTRMLEKWRTTVDPIAECPDCAVHIAVRNITECLMVQRNHEREYVRVYYMSQGSPLASEGPGRKVGIAMHWCTVSLADIASNNIACAVHCRPAFVVQLFRAWLMFI